MLRGYVKFDPKQVLLLAQNLGEHGDIDEALDICQTVIDAQPGDIATVLRLAVRMLGARRNEITKQQIDRVAAWALPLMQANPTGPVAVLLKAEMADLRGEYHEVVRILEALLNTARLLRNATRSIPDCSRTIWHLRWPIALVTVTKSSAPRRWPIPIKCSKCLAREVTCSTHGR